MPSDSKSSRRTTSAVQVNVTPPSFGRNPRAAPDGVRLDGGRKIGQKNVRPPTVAPASVVFGRVVADAPADDLEKGSQEPEVFISREDAQHIRQAMEQRRNSEIPLFGALTTAQIALVALAASQSGKDSAHPTARFCGLAAIVLFVTYAAVVVMIEIQNRRNRRVYGKYETQVRGEKDFELYGFWKSAVMSWAAWPVVAAAVITVLLVWTTADLGW